MQQPAAPPSPFCLLSTPLLAHPHVRRCRPLPCAPLGLFISTTFVFLSPRPSRPQTPTLPPAPTSCSSPAFSRFDRQSESHCPFDEDVMRMCESGRRDEIVFAPLLKGVVLWLHPRRERAALHVSRPDPAFICPERVVARLCPVPPEVVPLRQVIFGRRSVSVGCSRHVDRGAHPGHPAVVGEGAPSRQR